MPVPTEIVHRDKKNALSAKDQAHSKLRTVQPSLFIDDITGSFYEANKARFAHFDAEHKSLIAICQNPFHAMVEVNTELRDGQTRKNVLWYSNENTNTLQNFGDVVILPWTHPAIQLALTEDIGDSCDIDDPRYE